MTRFIVVHTPEGLRMAINVEHIVCVYLDLQLQHAVISCTQTMDGDDEAFPNDLDVAESFEAIMARLEVTYV